MGKACVWRQIQNPGWLANRKCRDVYGVCGVRSSCSLLSKMSHHWGCYVKEPEWTGRILEDRKLHKHTCTTWNDSLQVLKEDNDLRAVMLRDVPTLRSVRSRLGDPKQLSVCEARSFSFVVFIMWLIPASICLAVLNCPPAYNCSISQ